MEFDSGGSGGTLNAFFVAVDGGPRATLAPIAAHCGARLADVSADAAASDASWTGRLAATAPSLLVVGTSDSTRGRAIEAAARRTAHRAKLPIVAIEDFPGNYVEVPGGEAALVLTESPAARDICLRKVAPRGPGVAVVPSARYDPYRSRLDELRRDTSSRWARDPPGRYRVLWAGQPETEDCMRTLAALLPALKGHAAELLFKAHPRDSGYISGAYAGELARAGVDWTDLTAASVDEALTRAPHLVVTQFSSVAIDAGFFGIPSVWILLPDAGAARLAAKKGYAVPPLCTAGGAALARDAAELPPLVLRALTNVAWRSELTQCFDVYFAVDGAALPETLRRLAAVAQR